MPAHPDAEDDREGVQLLSGKELDKVSKEDSEDILVETVRTYTNIEKKISFYQTLELDNYVIENSKILIYNLDYIETRWKYIKNKNNKLDLFISEKDFYNKYNIKSLDLIKE